MADEVILEKEEGFSESSEAAMTLSNKPQIFIDQLFKKRDVLSPDEIRDEINTIIITVMKFECRK